jgi:malate dehydrogenase (quinone)
MEIKTDLSSSQKKKIYTNLFFGAGGGSLPPEKQMFLGRIWWFPVSGQWLKCTNPEVIAKHEAKSVWKSKRRCPLCRFHISILA